MSVGPFKVFAATMASANSVLSGFDLGRAWTNVYLQIPTMPSGSALDVYVGDSPSTMYPLKTSFVPPNKVVASTFASAGTTMVVDLGNTYKTLYLQVGSFNSSANLSLQAAIDGSNYYDLRTVSTSTMAVQSTFTVQASATANGCLIPIPGPGSALRLTADSAPSISVAFKILCNAGDPVSQTFTIAATAAANGSVVPLPAGFQYYKLYASDSAPTAATTFKILCSD